MTRLGVLYPLFALLTALSLAETPTDFRITGVVLSERDSTPVANCHLAATLSTGTVPVQGRRPRQRSSVGDEGPAASTDATGHFELHLPSAGDWQVFASAHGFRRQAFDRHEDYFSSVVLTPSAPAFDLVFRLEPDSAITGFVLDEAGEPVRSARVSLFSAGPSESDLSNPGNSLRSVEMTDDRGHYEFAGLAPGDYIVGLQAEPWYAAGQQQGRRSATAAGNQNPTPELDVVYQQTWFPGGAERRSAEILSLHHGEEREADFNLTPLPATHLHVPLAAVAAGAPQRQAVPTVERVTGDGIAYVRTSVQVDSQGQFDIGGLAPGLYKVSSPQPDGSQTQSFVRVPAGAQHTVDLLASVPAAEVTLRMDETGEGDRTQILLSDLETGAVSVSFGGGNLRRRGMDSPPASSGERKLAVPPGRYRVTLSGNNGLYLSGLSVKGQPLDGRVVTLPSGSTTLNLKVARGLASISGIANLAGKPLSGAMLLLVPATFGQSGSITVLRRDQTNTDGGYRVENAVPGDYIVLAIDHGWTVNWHDPATLARYLVHGIPVTLQPGAAIRQNLDAQMP